MRVPLSLLAALPFSVGCANRRDPRPPSLHLPNPATKLTAERVGDQVLLTWDTPSGTTDGGGIRPPITAAVCLDNAAPTFAPRKKPSKRAQKRPAPTSAPEALPPQPTCNEIKRLVVVPGQSEAAVDLPAALANGPAALLSFRIELRNDKLRSAGPSDAVLAVGGTPPPPAGALTVTAKRDGALVRWQAQPSPAAMELKRTLVATAEGAVSVAVPAAKTQSQRSQSSGARGLGTPKAPPREVLLRTPPEQKSDSGGVLDRTALDRNTYTYVAQRVENVSIAGKTLEVRGAPSAPTSFTYRDIFPPLAPTGLVSIPGGGFGAAPSIDLSWDAGPEQDILGYNVFRGADGGAFTRLNADPVPVPAFRDMTAQPGHSYTYRVTAVDKQQNESPASAEIRESLQN